MRSILVMVATVVACTLWFRAAPAKSAPAWQLDARGGCSKNRSKAMTRLTNPTSSTRQLTLSSSAPDCESRRPLVSVWNHAGELVREGPLGCSPIVVQVAAHETAVVDVSGYAGWDGYELAWSLE